MPHPFVDLAWNDYTYNNRTEHANGTAKPKPIFQIPFDAATFCNSHGIPTCFKTIHLQEHNFDSGKNIKGMGWLYNE
jgi:hypothetical protein